MMKANNYTVELQEDPMTGELILPIPVDILSQMGWSEGTELWWEEENGRVTIKEKKNGTGEE